ncbi:MAG: gliding motility-associated ABC transporter permease subunit GldF [Bacteroidales bacterium]|nr:gliding motility-associated ABC transporter permease subunit GldF [Bacteroidales bacterium]MCF8405574.1 gliding motility-associated ABC transporter permease subunit GldF [Bacteroidales bacterium]
MYVLLKKEVNGFFNSILGYIVIAVFLLVNGLFLWVFPVESNILDYGYASIDGLFLIGPFVFLFLIPAVTMRFFAEENKTGTIELLMTKPLTDIQVILSKYFAGLLIVLISLIPTLIYFLSVYQLGFPKGNIDTGGMWGSYIGLFFLGASFVAIGLFASSITDNQIVSFILAVVISSFVYIGFEFIYSLDLFGNIDLFVKNLGISAHYSAMSRGVIDTRDVLYFISVTGLFIVFTKVSLESRKW